jgi:hypothetical protein
MHNVLNVYSKQLRQSITSGQKKVLSDKLPADRVSLTPEAKRQATIEKVSKDILDKIARLGTRGSADHQPAEQAKPGVEKEIAADGENESGSSAG